MNILEADRTRYGTSKMPKFHYYFRKAQQGGPFKLFNKFIFIKEREKRNIDLAVDAKIGPGLYFGHPSGITINSHAVIGKNCNINKGVTIGRENRGSRKGCPTIGDEVWIGANATVVGAVNIGSDVLIAPNSFVNFDVPDHSIVIGNPGKIISRSNATADYISNKAEV